MTALAATTCTEQRHLWAMGATDRCLCGAYRAIGQRTMVKVENEGGSGPLLAGAVEQHLRALERRRQFIRDRIAGDQAIGKAPDGYMKAELAALSWALDRIGEELGSRLLRDVIGTLSGNRGQRLHDAIGGLRTGEAAKDWADVLERLAAEATRACGKARELAFELGTTEVAD